MKLFPARPTSSSEPVLPAMNVRGCSRECLDTVLDVRLLHPALRGLRRRCCRLRQSEPCLLDDHPDTDNVGQSDMELGV